MSNSVKNGSQPGLKNRLDCFYAPQWWYIPENVERAVTIKEACEVYRYSRSTILRKIKRGTIYGCKIGCRWAVFPAGLEIRRLPLEK